MVGWGLGGIGGLPVVAAYAHCCGAGIIGIGGSGGGIMIGAAGGIITGAGGWLCCGGGGWCCPICCCSVALVSMRFANYS